MVAQHQFLYLHEIPQERSGKVVQLMPENGDITPQQLAAILAAMTQTLLTDMSKLVEFLAEQQDISAQASQLDVSAAKAVQSQEEAAQKAYLQKLQEEENPPWWKKLLNVLTQYVLPIILCAVSAVIFGPAAGIISAIVFLATAVPVKDQQSLVGVISSSIAGAIGKACGWSAGTIEIVQGVLNVAMAVILAVVTGGAASSACAEEAVVETASSEVETAESSASTNAGKFVGVNTFSSVTANTNSWYDIAFGSWQITHSSQDDQEKGKLIATIFGIVMNLMVVIVSLKVSWSSATEVNENGTTLSSFEKALGSSNSTRILKVLNYISQGITGANVGASIDQAFEIQEMASLNAEITKQRGLLQLFEGLVQISSETSSAVGTNLKTRLSEYDTMLGNNPNYASVEFTAAKEMAICNNKA